ncbi:MAG: hypothetical protein ABH956_00275 [Candidatus Nealsonbacteria bacterium]
MIEERFITLPDRQEMLRRLMEVSDYSHRKKYCYPFFLRFAGLRCSALKVVIIFKRIVRTYTSGMLSVTAHYVSESMYAQSSEYMDALIDNKEIAQEAKTFLREKSHI